MAVATAYTAINMNNWTFYTTTGYGIVSESRIQEFGSSGSEINYYGSFTFINGSLSGGTVTRITQTAGPTRYDVTGLSRNAVTVDNYIESGDEGLLFGYLFSGNDTFTGSASADQLNGYSGADRMDGKGGADIINGGGGNDQITWGGGDTVNGAGGIDKLKIKSGNLNLFGMTNQSQITNIETVDMTGTNNNTLTVGKADVLDISSSTNTLTVLGNVGDTVDLRGAWVLDGSMSAPGFEFWKLGSAIVKVETELNVI